jgi:hypothetical protein
MNRIANAVARNEARIKDAATKKLTWRWKFSWVEDVPKGHVLLEGFLPSEFLRQVTADPSHPGLTISRDALLAAVEDYKREKD